MLVNSYRGIMSLCPGRNPGLEKAKCRNHQCRGNRWNFTLGWECAGKWGRKGREGDRRQGISGLLTILQEERKTPEITQQSAQWEYELPPEKSWAWAWRWSEVSWTGSSLITGSSFRPCRLGCHLRVDELLCMWRSGVKNKAQLLSSFSVLVVPEISKVSAWRL